MSNTSEQFQIINQRGTPIELHLPDGTVVVLAPRERLQITAAARKSIQVRALERQRAIRVSSLPRGPPGPPRGALEEVEHEPGTGRSE